MIKFKGVEVNSFSDYPGLISTVFFVGGCNMKCPYCHNPTLINNQNLLPDIKEGEALQMLNSRNDFKLIDAVVITGGEPSLYPEIVSFIRKVKRLGFKVKFDTNGTKPLIIKELLQKKLIDYIAMDVKSSESNYAKACGATKIDLRAIKRSIKLILNSGIDYEFRTTVVPGIHKKSDLLSVGKWLKGASLFVIQQFRSDFPTLDSRLMNKPTYSLKELGEFSKSLKNYFKEVQVRGQ